MAASRTHVVDLGCMAREELIEIAKKQATQIREKNTRINAMESFIESVTGASAEEGLAHSGLALASGSRASYSEPATPVYAASPAAGSPTASQLRELQQALEEEQVQHTLHVSQLEEQLRERQRDYDQLQAKVDAWKAKVMTAMTADQERIRVLEEQLSAAAAAPARPNDVPFGVWPPASVPPHSSSAFQNSPSASAPDADEEATSTAQLHAQVAALRDELEQTRARLRAAEAQPAREPSLSLTLSVSGDQARDSESARSSSRPPSACDIPADVLDAAVHAKLTAWKERVKTVMTADRDRITDLEAQLAAAQQEREAAVAASLGEHAAEVEALRAELSRLQDALAAAQQEREAAVVSMDAFRAKMEAWKVKVRTVVEDGERQRRTVEAEAQRLRDALAVAKADARAAADAAPVRVEAATEMERATERCEGVVQTEAEPEPAETGDLAAPPMECPGSADEGASGAAAVASAAESATVTEAAAGTPTVDAVVDDFVDYSAFVKPLVLRMSDIQLNCVQELLHNCNRVVDENRRLHRRIVNLTLFRETVMREMRSGMPRPVNPVDDMI